MRQGSTRIYVFIKKRGVDAHCDSKSDYAFFRRLRKQRCHREGKWLYPNGDSCSRVGLVQGRRNEVARLRLNLIVEELDVRALSNPLMPIPIPPSTHHMAWLCLCARTCVHTIMKEHFEMEANTYNQWNHRLSNRGCSQGKVAQLLSHRFHSPRESSARHII